MASESYLSKLNDVYKRKYLSKILLIGGEDPYESCDYEENFNLWPTITYFDLCNYLIFATNSVTCEQMKSYKSLESHNYFTSGLVSKKIVVKKVSSDVIIMRGEVNHSQSINATRVKVWVAATLSGVVKTAHCTCMAGQGESCSHVGAFLFSIITKLRLEEEKSCTDKKNMWMEPHFKDSLNKRVTEIDFSSSQMKRKKIFHCKSPADTKKNKPKISPCPPSENDIKHFFECVANTGVRSAVLSIVPEHAQIFKKETTVLKSLFDEKFKDNNNFDEILQHCKNLFYSIHISSEEALNIEMQTVKQGSCTEWFRYRAGRITASVIKSACNADITNPSMPLINKICNPQGYKFLTAATFWGCHHEEDAFNSYIKKMQDHTNFTHTKTGFCINPKYAHLGATPDRKIECSCCGKGVLEIKCPFCVRNDAVSALSAKSSSCLEFDELNNMTLKKNHQYFFQIQTQMFVCESDYCDFVVWTEKDIFIERLFPDEIFWEEVVTKSQAFFVHVILPELVAKWFSRLKK